MNKVCGCWIGESSCTIARSVNMASGNFEYRLQKLPSDLISFDIYAIAKEGSKMLVSLLFTEQLFELIFSAETSIPCK